MVEYYQKLTAGESFAQINTSRDRDVWVHSHATARDIDDLVQVYGLDRNIVTDVCDERELPRAEFSSDNLYVFIRTVENSRSDEVCTHPLLAIITPNLFISLSPHNKFSPSQVPDGSIVTTTKPQDLLVITLATAIGQYEHQVHHTGEMIGQMRRRLQTREINNDDFINFVTIEDSLNDYRMNLNGMLSVLRRLADNRHQTFSASNLESVDDMILHVEQLLVSVASHTQSTASIQTVYGTIANNHLNQRMKILTVFTVLLTLPNVFYGMYGMNVSLPYQDEAWIYPVIVLFTFSLILLVLLLAKRLRLF